MGLRAKFRLIVVLASLGLLVLSGLWLNSERSNLLASKKDQVRNLIDLPYSIISADYRLEQSGQITRSEAQARAIDAIRALRYDRTNYFWIMDMQPVMVMHPIEPELNGEDLSRYTDPHGKMVFVAMVRTVKNNGQGFVSYLWPRPGGSDPTPVPKLSFVKRFEPWGWVIGTGIYVDDVDAAWHRSAATAAGFGTVSLILLLLVSASIARSVFPRLDAVVNQMRKITTSEGDYSRVAGLFTESSHDRATHDEIEVMVSGLDEMLREIKKRDDRLLQHDAELERLVAARTLQLQTSNAQLETAHAEIELFLECIPSILIGLDRDGLIRRWNLTASQVFRRSGEEAMGRSLADCGIRWLHTDMENDVTNWLASDSVVRCDDLPYEREGSVRFAGFSVRPIFSQEGEKSGLIITGADVTEKKCLEEQLRQAQKLEAIGQLAAGIAHEINTPTQFIGDNTTFLKDSWEPVARLLQMCRHMRQEATAKGAISTECLVEFDRLSEQCDLAFLAEEIPRAIDQSLDGLQRVARIVRAMREFSYQGSDQMEAIDLNRAIETTITVAHAEWKHVAEVVTNLDVGLPPTTGLPGEIKQVILNLIVNAAHAIGDVVGDGPRGKGQITISTRKVDDGVEMTIADTGSGIPEAIRTRVFDPFFTTKPVGKGTGQGLSLAYATIVKKHHGRIWFDSKPREGTTFFVRLPLHSEKSPA